MIEVSGIRIPLSALDGSDERELAACRRALARKLHVRESDIELLERRRRSIDARKRGDVQLTFTLRAELAPGARVRADKGVKLVDERPFTFPAPVAHTGSRPVVVGAGCAGLFCALSLARAGLEPLLVERGDDAARRAEAVRRHNETGELDVESNIQFGVGGAGTFSDGKLQTGTRSPAHRLILETFVAAGAQRQILWDAKPHVGSDVLPRVVTDIVRQIEEAGGEVRTRCRMSDLDVTGGRVHSVTLATTGDDGVEREERVSASCVVLACGHSARDVFELLRDRGVALERKTFAMGVRIEHLQADIDRALYGPAAGHPALGAAPYGLSCHLPSSRSAFSFCMCPGGYVVSAASERGGVCTNGMSLSDRAGTNANAGLLANVFPEDLPGDDALAGVELQRACERAAFAAGGGAYVAPAQLVGDFLQGVPSSAGGRVRPTYPRGVSWGDVATCLPPYVAGTLRDAIPVLGRRLRGFDAADAVLTGVETRSSSPVRVTRGDDGQSVSVRGLWPVGEGAGYAGGIMSAATDGILAAQKIVGSL
ncbi:FAD-dependent protein [Olsenella sp. An270]|uniref:NAD(P)/FAD-dependent oxidoreductase n=1 Tax=Olsenella sp. An270 TaxID=1965615 RepID=UPI000B3A75FB|nr:FAD-binding protein [Olsenella sp. An270]OUO60699.1 FAD-dependent oxidoreductase [Olsenella sp. An270]